MREGRKAARCRGTPLFGWRADCGRVGLRYTNRGRRRTTLASTPRCAWNPPAAWKNARPPFDPVSHQASALPHRARAAAERRPQDSTRFTVSSGVRSWCRLTAAPNCLDVQCRSTRPYRVQDALRCLIDEVADDTGISDLACWCRLSNAVLALAKHTERVQKPTDAHKAYDSPDAKCYLRKCGDAHRRWLQLQLQLQLQEQKPDLVVLLGARQLSDYRRDMVAGVVRSLRAGRRVAPNRDEGRPGRSRQVDGIGAARPVDVPPIIRAALAQSPRPCPPGPGGRSEEAGAVLGR